MAVPGGQRLSVRVTAVAHSDDVNQAVTVRDPVNHAPLSHADAPKIGRAFQLRNAGWARFRHQRLNLLEDAPGNLGIKVLQFFTRRSREDD